MAGSACSPESFEPSAASVLTPFAALCSASLETVLASEGADFATFLPMPPAAFSALCAPPFPTSVKLFSMSDSALL